MDLNERIARATDAQLCRYVEELPLALYPQVAELLRRFNEQALTLTVKVDATAALEAIGDTAANLAKMATDRNAVIDECIKVVMEQDCDSATEHYIVRDMRKLKVNADG